MDQRTDDIRQEIDTIRGSMTDKLEAIETKIKGTVEDTTTNIKQTFDLQHQVANNPWKAFGAAVLAGYILGNISDDSPRYSPDASRTSYSGSGSPSQPHSPGVLDQLSDSVGTELQTLKSLAVSTLVGLVSDTVKRNVPVFKDAMEQVRYSGQASSISAPTSYSSYQGYRPQEINSPAIRSDEYSPVEGPRTLS